MKGPSSSLWKKFQSEYVRSSVREGVRPDGRSSLSCREVDVRLIRGEGEAVAEASFGATQCLGLARCEVTDEADDVGGMVAVSVDVAAHLGEPAWGPELSRTVHGLVTRSVDREALSVVAGSSAWVVSVHVHVLAFDGNVLDCALMAAMAAVRHLRRGKADVDRQRRDDDEKDDDDDEMDDRVTTGGKSKSKAVVVVASADLAEPTPVPLVRSPLAVTVALFDGKVVLDPTDEEEAAADATVALALDSYGRLLGLAKLGGKALPAGLLRTCADSASQRARVLHELLDDHLLRADSAWRDARVARINQLGEGSHLERNN